MSNKVTSLIMMIRNSLFSPYIRKIESGYCEQGGSNWFVGSRAEWYLSIFVWRKTFRKKDVFLSHDWTVFSKEKELIKTIKSREWELSSFRKSTFELLPKVDNHLNKYLCHFLLLGTHSLWFKKACASNGATIKDLFQVRSLYSEFAWESECAHCCDSCYSAVNRGI